MKTSAVFIMYNISMNHAVINANTGCDFSVFVIKHSSPLVNIEEQQQHVQIKSIADCFSLLQLQGMQPVTLVVTNSPTLDEQSRRMLH